MNAEVVTILEHKVRQMQEILGEDDPTATQISNVFDKSLAYVKRFSHYRNPEAVKQVRESLSRRGLAEFEICVIGNLVPDTVEEAKTLVPTLAQEGRFDDDAIASIVQEISNLKKFE
eukprot:TRINITY_DN2982_c0_g1_i1.p1 TRINITY_DN2982_c0_g1~~TRINITY_DN2982_c0_g1_i1.p1  ORF type:complete len:117 (+),score=24.20 TRINITY_DN2982_c0_g1_i1:46-396(+)